MSTTLLIILGIVLLIAVILVLVIRRRRKHRHVFCDYDDMKMPTISKKALNTRIEDFDTKEMLGDSVESLKRRRKISEDIANQENSIKFTAFNSKNIKINQWSSILVYLWLEKAYEKVKQDYNIRKNLLSGPHNEKTSETNYSIPTGSEITVIPEIDGFNINPPFQKINWLEDWHSIEFRIKNQPNNQQSSIVFGKVSFYVEPILIAQVNIQFNLLSDEGLLSKSNNDLMSIQEAEVQEVFRKIFVSYSHDDVKIVERLEKAYQVLGDDYLRDLRILRSGEMWNPKLLSEIEKANIFQLCWSNASRKSINVEQEWKHAYKLNRPYFIRPVYWELPMPEPPVELSRIHFSYLNYNS
jgi:LPXTG-motif cell wall-anchored protein